ncbi:MAG TPA: TlpA disulfide reductase family protein [Parasegetibacter sp.]
MKRILQFSVFSGAVAVFLAFSANAQQQIKISGTYNVIPKAGEKVFLTVLLDPKTKSRNFIDSAVVTNNRFSFDVKAEPGKYDLVNTKGEAFPIYLDYGVSNITIDSFFTRAKISGNPTDSLIKQYEATGTGLSMLQLGMVLMNQKYQKEGKEMPDSLVNQLKTSFEATTAKRKELAKSIGSRKDLAAAYVLANGADAEFNTDELNRIYAGLPDYVKSTTIGKNFKSRLDMLNSLAIGVKAPVFKETAPDGNEVDFASFVKGKKLVLIDFWASWCGPCRKENPNVVALYNEYKGKGFDIIGVSLDSKKEDWLKAIADDKLTWTHVSDLGGWKSKVAQLYNVTAVPHTVLVDGNGKILAKNLRGKELDAFVAEHCNKP